ncbi:MAG: AhpC/TSA family protein [Bacteroidales bacterium]|nr:AhpC/TSA family protein [Bacteroidales bacterium]
MKQILATLFIVMALFLSNCGRENKSVFTIKGEVSDSLANIPGVKALLMQESPRQTDTCDLVNGKFEFTGEADNLSGAIVFISTPEHPQPDFDTPHIMPDFFVPVVKEKGVTEIFIGDEINVKSGELSRNYYDFQKAVLAFQIEINKAMESEPEEEKALKIQDSIYSQMNQMLREYYERNTDNVIGVNSLQIILLGNSLSDEDIIRYWDMASPQLREDKSLRQVLEMCLSARGLKLGEDGKIVEKASGNASVGKKFVDFWVRTVDGTPGRISDYLGKGDYVLMDFWAHWCGPCINEMKNLARINAEYAGKNFKMISVSIEDEVVETPRVIKENNMTWTQLVSTDEVLDNDYGIFFIPYLILFSPDGTILEKNIRGQALDEALKKYLGE